MAVSPRQVKTASQEKPPLREGAIRGTSPRGLCRCSIVGEAGGAVGIRTHEEVPCNPGHQADG